MDSANSGSLQSSSGGDDEFDSRCGGGGADSSPLSALLRQSASESPSSMASGFRGSFYGLQELASPPPQLPVMSQAAAHQWKAALPGGGGAGAGTGASPSPSSSPHGVQVSAEQAGQAQQGVAPPMRGSRKRTRASRRAPTTVLTTDTSNFRAMVQEFTGIPSPRFAGPPARSRFDHLFPAPSSLRSASAGSPSLLPAYLLHPFAQKLHPSPFPPFPSPSTSSPPPSNIANATSAAASAAPSTAAVTAPTDRYHLASAPSSSILGMQDHGGNYLSFQSHLCGAQLGGDSKYTAHPMFDAPGRDLAPPAQSLQDPVGFLGLTHGIMGADGTHMHQHQRGRDHGHGGDELSGVVGGASMTGSGGGRCRKTTYSSGAGAAHAAPQLERNAESTLVTVAAAPKPSSAAAATTAMRTQSVDSWICTSE